MCWSCWAKDASLQRVENAVKILTHKQLTAGPGQWAHLSYGAFYSINHPVGSGSSFFPIEASMSEQLTKLESSIYQYLLDFTAEHTYQPSIRDIGRQFKIKSTKTVSDVLQALAKKGYIERDPARSRGVRLVGFSGAVGATPVPYYGKIHAGEPALRPEHREGFITVDRRFLPSDQVFFLKVKGDSMVGRSINDGDFVMVDAAAAPKQNDIVAARIG